MSDDLAQRVRFVLAMSDFNKRQATVNEAADRIDTLTAERDRVREIHQPTDEEAEVWADGPGEDTHAEEFPDCTDCDGHTVTIQVCRECGYEHDGETPIFRPWPCPTRTALADPTEAAVCSNCDGQKCMACAFREQHGDCEHDCPMCTEEAP